MSRSELKLFATASIVCFSYSALAVMLMHLLRPDYPPVSSFISDYAVGAYGWVMRTAFLAMSGGCLTLMLALLRSDLTSIIARIGAVLIGIASIGLLTSAIFSTDLPGDVPTQSGEIHTMSFFVNITSIFLAALLLSISFRDRQYWRTYQRTAYILTALIVIAFVIQFLTLHRGQPYGIANRFFFAVLLLWIFMFSIRLRTSARIS